MENEQVSKSENPLILVVDDQPDVRQLIQFNLKKIGYTRVLTAANGREALDKAAKEIPDLILLDIMMPVMDGIKACAEFKKDRKFKDIPIIIVSSMDDIRNKAAAYGSGADDFIAKPLDNITLAARCRAMIQVQKLKEHVRQLTDKRSISDNLFNYQHLFERLVASLEHCRTRKLPFSIVYADIDYMKLHNVTYNSFTGDKIIRQVRGIFYDKVENFGSVFTSNSDKLVTMLPGMDEGKVRVLVDDIIEKVRKISLPVEFERKLAEGTMFAGNRNVSKVTLSVGIVTWDKPEGVPAQKLLDLAEKALNSAKEEGRDKKVHFQFYSQPDAAGTHKIDKSEVKEYRRNDEY